ncbi:MAG: TetR/AcrR family transcriptional regulator [Oceanospirillaceae bacterium]|nr:TetR/AcrR family transcriptional regulator [Oceanospirillaceae bacterium]
MGRPSKKEERTEEILLAFQRCVSRFGLEGSTLERIAEEAGLKRSLVRHFVGNRDELVAMLADRVIDQSNVQWDEFLAYMPPQHGCDYLLNGLFNEHHSDPAFVMVIESLIFAAGRDAVLQKKMKNWMQHFSATVTEILRHYYPQASEQDLAAVSFGLVSLYFNLDSLSPLAMTDIYRVPARQAAEQLVRSLKSSQEAIE